jgi:hypothetical protein
MKTISNREFAGNLDHYFDVAREQDEVRVKKGRETYRLVCEASIPQQPVLQPDDDYRRAISAEDFREKLVVAMRRVDEKYARK